MTFSDRRVVDLVRDHFVPVWESAAPVKIATFDLGDGRALRGTVGGEIAIYFCRPDGIVFDILPALHSPHVTYWAIRKALDFYRHTGATDAAIAEYHRRELLALKEPSEESLASRRKLAERKTSPDAATRTMSEMAFGKTGNLLAVEQSFQPAEAFFFAPENLVVVEPGGLSIFERAVHEAFATAPLRTPAAWKEPVFVGILGHDLVGGEFRYDVDTLEPMSIIEE